MNIFNKEDTVEVDYFKAHKNVTLINNAIVGSLTYANDYPEILRKYFAQEYPNQSLDKLDKFIPKIRNNLEEIGETPKIIFFHCVAGEDRTGEVFGAYKMLYNNWTYQ